MSSLGWKLWHASPATLVEGMRSRLRKAPQNVEATQWFTINAGPAAGAAICLNTPLGSATEAIVDGTYDGFMYDRLQKRCSIEGAVVWDLGAHMGYHSLCFAALGARAVLAFEPNPSNSARLMENLNANPSLARTVNHLPVAVANVDGELSIVESGELRGESSCSHLEAGLAPLNEAAYAGFARRMVETVRVDTLIEERKQPMPDVVKIDVEGAEGMVLRGGARFFAHHAPVLFIEVHHIVLMMEIQKLLGGWGYSTEVMEEARSTPSRCLIVAVRD
ncbi:MAG: FkbM family methyltransferase [Gemmatimonadota bacterium]